MVGPQETYAPVATALLLTSATRVFGPHLELYGPSNRKGRNTLTLFLLIKKGERTNLFKQNKRTDLFKQNKRTDLFKRNTRVKTCPLITKTTARPT